MQAGQPGAAFGPAGASVPGREKPVETPAARANIGSMDAANPSATPTFASRTPLHIGAVGLIARDLDLLTNFYRDLLGLTVLERTGDAVPARRRRHDADRDRAPARRQARRSGAGRPLPHRVPDADAAGPRPLDHAHRQRNRVPITGASDHGVSEAFYLDDPEGNGIEVYNDRPRERWNWENGLVTMPTKQLDIEAILREIDPAHRHLSGGAGGPAHRPRASSRRHRSRRPRNSIAARSAST